MRKLHQGQEGGRPWEPWGLRQGICRACRHVRGNHAGVALSTLQTWRDRSDGIEMGGTRYGPSSDQAGLEAGTLIQLHP
jgi:hypothetical protein